MVRFEDRNSEDEEEKHDLMDRSTSISSERATPNGKIKRKSEDEGHGAESTKKKRKSKSEKTSHHKANGAVPKRRHSMSKPARDPRDDPSLSNPKLEVDQVRSPSPIIDFDGLSRPSMIIFGDLLRFR
jgi:GTP cyclohydrolase I